MRQAIITRYLGPTNFRGSRVKATCEALSVTISWDHSLNTTGNHTRAAKELASRLGWIGQWCGGGLYTGEYCFVSIPSDMTAENGFDDDSNFFIAAESERS